MLRKIIIVLCTCLTAQNLLAQIKISMLAADIHYKNTCIKTAIEDAQHLFSNAKGCTFSFDTSNAHIILLLPIDFSNHAGINEAYLWEVKNKVWQLTATSPKGIANGIYGLMQQILGFKFYHPKEIQVPNYTQFVIPAFNRLSGTPSFENIGFHLHTMHPIELTEDLLDEKREGGIERIYEYINWLARNGQNYFEFNVLESIQLETWVPHAKKISTYAHQRGIKCGLDLSLHMLQQKAFQLYETPPYKFSSIQSQIKKNVNLLVQAGFDIWNVELSATEFTTGNQTKKKKILQFLTGLLQQNHIQLMSRSHVVKPTEMVNSSNGHEAGDILADGQGLMVHTVMFYSLTDDEAPVYRNKNLKHMYHILLKEKGQRPTWYFPESAYWVTFDNSVPMFLLPYFSARLLDIELCEKENINGHLTFTSGWEWGYGYIDWSIARWCWQYSLNDIPVKRTPLQYVLELSTSNHFKEYIQTEEKLQQTYIKQKQLIKVLVAQTITDEIPGPFNLEFHPRPLYPYPYIRNKASMQQLDSVVQLYLHPLKEYFTMGLAHDSLIKSNQLNPVEKEIFDGIQITHLRACHKWYTLKYIVEHRKNLIKKQHTNIANLLIQAKKIRLSAINIVKEREAGYRYDLALLSTKHIDHTCYHFGYLYTVHQLHFWEREEMQAQHNNYQFWYRSIWNVGRTVGLFD